MQTVFNFNSVLSKLNSENKFNIKSRFTKKYERKMYALRYLYLRIHTTLYFNTEVKNNCKQTNSTTSNSKKLKLN